MPQINPWQPLALVAAKASGSEATFDQRPMQPGTHLRWSFAPELGFPANGFRLYRRIAQPDETRIPLPADIWKGGNSTAPIGGSSTGSSASWTNPGNSQGNTNSGNGGSSGGATGSGASGGNNGSTGNLTSGTAEYPLPLLPGPNEWQALLAQSCQSITVKGRVAAGCEEVALETFVYVSPTEIVITGRVTLKVAGDSFTITVRAALIKACRVIGALSIDEADCGVVQAPACWISPPTATGGIDGGGGGSVWGNNPSQQHSGSGSGPNRSDGGGGGSSWGSSSGSGGNSGGSGGSNGGGSSPGSDSTKWGAPDPYGWQEFGEVFNLPVTVATWPGRYPGAPGTVPADPNAPELVSADTAEFLRRLSFSFPDPAQSPPPINFGELRAELVRMVQDPDVLQYNHFNQPATGTGGTIPNLRISLMEQLSLAALTPYMARTLGLYYVDSSADPNLEYDYFIIGDWGKAAKAAVRQASPGQAQVAALLRGWAQVNGLTVAIPGATSQDPGENRPAVLWPQRLNARPDVPRYNFPRTVSEALAKAGNSQGNSLLAVQPLSTSPASEVLRIKVARPVAQVDIQLGGVGTVSALHNGMVVARQEFSVASGLTSLTLSSPDYNYLTIDELRFVNSSSGGGVIVIGPVMLHILPADKIGGSDTGRLAWTVHAPQALKLLDQPLTPAAISRRREAVVDLTSQSLVARSLIEVQWPAPSRLISGEPGAALGLPSVDRPAGFIAERQDSATGVVTPLPKIIGAVSRPTLPEDTLQFEPPPERIFSFSDSDVADATAAWNYRVAGFDLFGATGYWSEPSNAVQVERVAGPPTDLRLVSFDNSAAGGGAADGDAWLGGTLKVRVGWSGAALASYLDIHSARINIGLDGSGETLLTEDFEVPAPVLLPLKQLVSISLATNPQLSGRGVYTLQTSENLPRLDSEDPSWLLIVVNQAAQTKRPLYERYVVRPDGSNSLNLKIGSNPGGTIAEAATSGNGSLLANYRAFLVAGVSLTQNGTDNKELTFKVPLRIPVERTRLRARLYVTASMGKSFDPALAGSDSTSLYFTGQQWLIPPVPPLPEHIVRHQYYDPADFYGRASLADKLPFTSAILPGVSGYILQRAPLHSLFLADLKRYQRSLDQVVALNSSADPLVASRPDLKQWMLALPEWFEAYVRRSGNPAGLTTSNVLGDPAARRAFIQHFYNGLLDDELAELGDIPANLAGFARVNPQPILPGQSLTDIVDGKGFGRVVYKLAAVNQAGSSSVATSTVGPYYTRGITPPRPPVLFSVLAAVVPPQGQGGSSSTLLGGLTVSWTLEENPDIAAYLVYRATQSEELADLRYFGQPDGQGRYPDPASLPKLVYRAGQLPALSFSPEDGDIDRRLIGLVPDPRLFARDYEGSDMAEIVLPLALYSSEGDDIKGVYRLSEFNPEADPLDQPQAFNYWRPAEAGGVSKFTPGTVTGTTRLAGLRVGLGRGVAVVVVAEVSGKPTVVAQVNGSSQLPGSQNTPRRGVFQDLGQSADLAKPADPNATPGWSAPTEGQLYYYAVVAVDLNGNRSASSAVYAAMAPALAVGATA